MSQRIDRVDELLRQEIGAILAKDVQDPHIGFATVTDVETTPDLRHARVWVSVIGATAERRETVEALQRAMPFVRHELGVRLRIKRIPALHISLDDSAERGTRVLRILDELESGDVEAGEAIADAPRGESLPTPVARMRLEGDTAPDEVEEAASLDVLGQPGRPGKPRLRVIHDRRRQGGGSPDRRQGGGKPDRGRGGKPKGPSR